MKELKDIIQAYYVCRQQQLKAVLATVVHLDGSSYRRPGARMLVSENGVTTGAISGGCLEGDALKKALMCLGDQSSRLVTYDTADEEYGEVGLQLGCEGVIQVLFEYIDPEKQDNVIQLLEKAVAKRQKAVLFTFFDLRNRNDLQQGTSLLMEEQGELSGSCPACLLPEQLIAEGRKVLISADSLFSEIQAEKNTVYAFLEFLEPPVSLVIVGAGNDAIPLAQLAGIMGWETRIVDGRGNYARKERFTNACQILVSRPEEVLQQIPIDSRTAFVLMTHNYNYDLKMLQALFFRQLPYIGILGPKKKFMKMLDELVKTGAAVCPEELEKIHAPTGLDLGAETPEEIAISILAEIQAVMNGGQLGKLKERTTEIHKRANLQFIQHQLKQP